MRRLVEALVYLSAIIAPVLMVAPATAQAPRTWVSGVGDDVNPCSRTAPCKTFAGSFARTAPGGEINCIDAGGFGVLNITKSITISCEIGTAGVAAGGTNGFTINAAATDVVVLNGLDIDGFGTGVSGISIVSAAAVHVRHSQIRNFKGGGSGITVAPTSIPVRVFVSDSLIANNGNSTTTGGIQIKPQGSGAASVVITNTRIDANTAGVLADASGTSGSIRTTIEGSSVSGSTNDGASATANPASGNILMIAGSLVSNNGSNGVISNGATVLLGTTVVTGNVTGLSTAAGGSLLSYRTNNVNGNTNDNAAAATATSLQ